MSIKPVIFGLIICMALIASACAETPLNEATPVYVEEQSITITQTPYPVPINEAAPVFVDEQLEAKRSPEYLKAQWEISNFTKEGTISKFWIRNYLAPDLSLNEITVKNHDTGESITFVYTKKTTSDGKETDSIWNLFGLLNPDSKLSKDETCQIVYSDEVKNIDVSYNDITKTHWGDA